MKIFVSAGEASGEQYAAWLVETMRRRFPGAEFIGCVGPQLRAAGVRPVAEAGPLAVVGLVEVLSRLPRIYREFRRLCEALRVERPDLAILTDAPDFHLRLAKRLRRMGVPVVYLVAPQVWAWRGWRVRLMRRVINRLLCIFPFEEGFFQRRGIPAVYIGHPLVGKTAATTSREQFFQKHELEPERPLIAVLPGSRPGEADRHLTTLLQAVKRLNDWQPSHFLLAASTSTGRAFFEKRIAGSGVQIVEGETSDLLAHADLALVASGTATIEAALLGTPMVTFYRVHPASWWLGKWFLRAPYYSMVNLLAGRAVVPELIQGAFTPRRLVGEARRILQHPSQRQVMRRDLAGVQQLLAGKEPAMDRAAGLIAEMLDGEPFPAAG